MKKKLVLFFTICACVLSALHPDPVTLASDFGGKKEFTVSCWIKFDASMMNQANYGILYKGSRSGFPEMQFQICLRRDRPEFKYISKSGRWSGIMMNGSDWVGIGKRVPLQKLQPLRPDHWTMLTGTYSSNGILTLYVDGKEYFKTERNSAPPINQYPVVFGRSEWGTGLKCWDFPGLITRFTALDKCLSQKEVALMEKEQRVGLDEQQIIPGATIPKTSFAVKLKRTAAYESALPESLPGKPNIHATIKKVNGVPQLFINHTRISSIAMMPSPYVSPAESEKSVRDFAAAGVRIYSTILWSQGKRNDWWLGDGVYDFSAVDRRLNALLKAAPQGYIFPRIKLDPPEWWIAKNKGEMEYGNMVSPSSEKWRTLYRKMLKDLILHIENSPYAGRVFAYQFGAFVGSEWLLYRKLSSAPSLKAYAAFAKGQKSAAKQDPFDPAAKNEPDLYNTFVSNEIADVILDIAGLIKRLTNGKKLTGIFYGYDTDTHRAFDRIVRSPLVDFFCSPTSYVMRNAGDSGQFTNKYWASMRLHNKMYFDEADIRTHYYNLRVDYRCANLMETCNVIKRAIGYSLTKGTSLWWFLLVGNETFHDENIMSVIAGGAKENAAALRRERTAFSPNAEVAVFFFNHQPRTYYADLYAKFYLDTLSRSGVPFDVYSLNDATHPELPEYKMYIFLNPPENMPEFRRKGLKLWIFQSAFTTVKMQKHLPSAPVTSHFLQGDRKNGLNLKLSRYSSVADPEATILGTFNGKPAAAVKGNDAWFLAIPDIASLHTLYQKAGVHIWNRSGDVLFAGNGYVMLHAASSGEKTICLPQKYRIHDVFSTSDIKKKRIGHTFRLFLNKGETKIFRLSPVSKENKNNVSE